MTSANWSGGRVHKTHKSSSDPNQEIWTFLTTFLIIKEQNYIKKLAWIRCLIEMNLFFRSKLCQKYSILNQSSTNENSSSGLCIPRSQRFIDQIQRFVDSDGRSGSQMLTFSGGGEDSSRFFDFMIVQRKTIYPKSV